MYLNDSSNIDQFKTYICPPLTINSKYNFSKTVQVVHIHICIACYKSNSLEVDFFSENMYSVKMTHMHDQFKNESFHSNQRLRSKVKACKFSSPNLHEYPVHFEFTNYSKFKSSQIYRARFDVFFL